MAERSHDVQRAYNEWVYQYDVNINLTRDLNADVLRQQSFDLTGKRVLEIGCGTGLNTVWLAERAQRVIGMDLSDGMLQTACDRLRGLNVDVLQADITKPWPLHQGFDVLIATLILEHVYHLAPVFSEACRVLHPGGLLYISELHPYKQLQGTQARYHQVETGQDVLVPAFRHQVSEYTNEAIEAGFTLRHLGEWQHASDTAPRLLTLLFERL
jgi:2-polyprenyl-3-methyl-5-hydroxy-6-metoxy-1,4-benzoquinol methylase